MEGEDDDEEEEARSEKVRRSARREDDPMEKGAAAWDFESGGLLDELFCTFLSFAIFSISPLSFPCFLVTISKRSRFSARSICFIVVIIMQYHRKKQFG